MTVPPFRLNRDLDRAALGARYAVSGQVRIAEFLEPATAAYLHDHLRSRTDWLLLIGNEEKVFQVDSPTRAAFTAARRAALDDAVYAAARDGFQFRFESIRVPDLLDTRKSLGGPLAEFACWMAGDEVLDLIRTITDDDRVRFADAQATRYYSGDFLTGHDDQVHGKSRRAAYVFGLTKDWRLEWGGLLVFHGENARFTGLAPDFNTLDVFRVPQVHSVSLVTPAAAHSRLAVTGWLRESGIED